MKKKNALPISNLLRQSISRMSAVGIWWQNNTVRYYAEQYANRRLRMVLEAELEMG